MSHPNRKKCQPGVTLQTNSDSNGVFEKKENKGDSERGCARARCEDVSVGGRWGLIRIESGCKSPCVVSADDMLDAESGTCVEIVG